MGPLQTSKWILFYNPRSYAILRDHEYGDSLFVFTSPFAGTRYAYPNVMAGLNKKENYRQNLRSSADVICFNLMTAREHGISFRLWLRPTVFLYPTLTFAVRHLMTSSHHESRYTVVDDVISAVLRSTAAVTWPADVPDDSHRHNYYHLSQR